MVLSLLSDTAMSSLWWIFLLWHFWGFSFILSFHFKWVCLRGRIFAVQWLEYPSWWTPEWVSASASHESIHVSHNINTPLVLLSVLFCFAKDLNCRAQRCHLEIPHSIDLKLNPGRSNLLSVCLHHPPSRSRFDGHSVHSIYHTHSWPWSYPARISLAQGKEMLATFLNLSLTATTWSWRISFWS